MPTPHNPGYEYGSRVITSRLLPNERLLSSIEGMYVVRPNRWEWGCIAVSDMRLHFCGRKRLKTITRTFQLSDIQSPVLTHDNALVAQGGTYGEGSNLSFQTRFLNHQFLLVKREQKQNERFVETFFAAHQSQLARVKSDSKQPADPTPMVYSEAANRESKRNKILFSIAAAILLIAGVSIVNSRVQQSRIDDAIRNASSEAKLLSDGFCEFVDSQLATTPARSQSAYDSVSERYNKADAEIRSIINDKYDIPTGESPYFLLERPLSDCRNAAYERIAPTTTAPPRERSDAELAAEGKTCAQQWRSAARETASGGSQDVQLRGTLYACDTFEDWVIEAFNNGEYSDYLIDVACASEPNAPRSVCS